MRKTISRLWACVILIPILLIVLVIKILIGISISIGMLNDIINPDYKIKVVAYINLQTKELEVD